MGYKGKSQSRMDDDCTPVLGNPHVTGSVPPQGPSWSRRLFASSRARPKSCAAPWQSDTDSCKWPSSRSLRHADWDWDFGGQKCWSSPYKTYENWDWNLIEMVSRRWEIFTARSGLCHSSLALVVKFGEINGMESSMMYWDSSNKQGRRSAGVLSTLERAIFKHLIRICNPRGCFKNIDKISQIHDSQNSL